ncbi:MAG: hypothetical protein ACRDPE_18210 [Solirubrobacterales bacterium]
MTVKTKIAALLAASAMLLAPATALAEGPTYSPAKPPHPPHPAKPMPGPKASLPEKAKAYGVYCRGASKKHEKGKKGTPFSECVTGVAKAITVPTTAKAACKGVSKERVEGQKRTPYATCVVAAAQAKKAAAAS